MSVLEAGQRLSRQGWKQVEGDQSLFVEKLPLPSQALGTRKTGELITSLCGEKYPGAYPAGKRLC